MSGAAIVLDRADFSFGDTSFAFDCRVAAGSVAAVLGPSGAGKSTLLNLVAGFEVPDRGRVLIGGADVTGVSPAQRPVSMVFQENNLFAHLSVEQNVGLGRSPSLRLTEADREAIAGALARTGLGGKERRLPRDGGWLCKRSGRVQVDGIRLLAPDPDLWRGGVDAAEARRVCFRGRHAFRDGR